MYLSARSFNDSFNARPMLTSQLANLKDIACECFSPSFAEALSLPRCKFELFPKYCSIFRCLNKLPLLSDALLYERCNLSRNTYSLHRSVQPIVHEGSRRQHERVCNSINTYKEDKNGGNDKMDVSGQCFFLLLQCTYEALNKRLHRAYSVLPKCSSRKRHFSLHAKDGTLDPLLPLLHHSHAKTMMPRRARTVRPSS